MMSHVLADMIGDNRNVPSDYSLSEYSAYIRTKFTELVKSYHVVRGERYNSLSSNNCHNR